MTENVVEKQGCIAGITEVNIVSCPELLSGPCSDLVSVQPTKMKWNRLPHLGGIVQSSVVQQMGR